MRDLPQNWWVKTILVVFGAGLILNLLILDFRLFFAPQTQVSPLPQAQVLPPQGTGQCPAPCLEMIAQVATQPAAVARIVERVVEKEVAVLAPSAPQATYIPFGGAGSTTSRDWVDVPGSGAFVNLSEYSGVTAVVWEVFLRVNQGNGRAYARLFDVTHGIAVAGSEISTDSSAFALVGSGQLSLWAGNNEYRVQVKSLTGYEAFVESPRLKITTK